MCELTYCNLGNPQLNSTMLYFLSLIGSEKHDDGFGFIRNNGKVWKTELAAKDTNNIGEILSAGITDNSPVPFHIRSATFGSVSKENSHPFTGKHFILMHNGTLINKDGPVPTNKDKDKDTDSFRFLLALDEAREKNKDAPFEEIFNSTIESFAGKFAFIIRCTDTNVDYVIRGKTAELWITTLTVGNKFLGYVVNTSKETLAQSVKRFVQIGQIFNYKKYNFSPPELLLQETIYIADKKGLTVVGKTKETEKPVAHVYQPVKAFQDDYSNFQHSGGGNWNRTSGNKNLTEIAALANRIYKFLSEHSLDLIDLQAIFQVISGISLLELSKEDLTAFVIHLIPKLSADSKIKARVKRELNGASFPISWYKKYSLEYPWTVNPANKIISVLEAESALKG